MDILTETRLADGTREQDVLVGDVPGILWLPPSPSPAPLVLIGHPGGMERMRSRLTARARGTTELGFAAAAIELPGTGPRAASGPIEAGRAALRTAVAGGGLPDDEVIDAFILPLVEQAVPEWQATMDALLDLPEIGGPVAISGGVVSVAIRLALRDPRVVAAGLFAGSFVPRSIIEEARSLTIPVHVLLQWDDEGNDRARSLELFDALGSREKTLQANLGGHTGVPPHAGEDAARFFARHLGGRSAS